MSSPCIHIVLVQPEIAENTGNIGRTCVALNAKLWLVRPLGFRLDQRRLRRAGLDYWQHLDVEVLDDWPALVERLPQDRFWCFSRHVAKPYTAASFSPGDVLVFGSESHGLPQSVLAANPQRCLQIPMPGPVRSLNLAVSVGIAAYEAFRQISAGGQGS